MLQLVEFNNLWKKHFQNEKELLQKAINGQECNDIEHIGDIRGDV